MRFNEEYKALLAKINIQKQRYAEKELAYSNEIDYLIIHHTEKKNKFTYRMIVYLIIAIIFLGLVYDLAEYINEKWIIWSYLGLILAIFIGMTIAEIVLIVKIKNLVKKQEKEQVEKKEIREQIVELNKQISSLVVSTIAMNEHYYELISLNDPQEKIKKWNQYTLEVINAINRKYDYKATWTDYQEFYRLYELSIESIIEANEK